MEKFNQKEPRQWTCDFIGSGTENAKNNSGYTGDLESSTMQTIGPSTTRANIIKM